MTHLYGYSKPYFYNHRKKRRYQLILKMKDENVNTVLYLLLIINRQITINIKYAGLRLLYRHVHFTDT